MEKLSFQDNTFLLTETASQKHHITGLFIIKKPAGVGRVFVSDIVESLRTSGPVDNSFRSKLKHASPSVNQEWVEDTGFDLDYHLRHYALPGPGNDQQLMRLANVIHSQGLDMNRPLWEYHIIDGIRGGRFAILGKQHHATVDGAGSMKMLDTFFSATKKTQTVVAPWSEKANRKSKPYAPRSNTRRPIEQALASSWDSAKEAPDFAGLVGKQIGRMIKGEYHQGRFPFAAPRSMFNRELGPARNSLMIDLPLNEMKALGAATGASINDVFLAVTGAALRRYLHESGELPPEPLVAMVPVSLKTKDDKAGNQLAVVHCQLAMGTPSSSSRLAGITLAMNEEKKFYKSLSRRMAKTYTNVMSLPQMAMMITGAADKVRPSYNLTVSNVRGPDKPRFLRGAELERFVPMSIVTEGNTLNITGISYAGKFQICVLVCPKSVPNAEKIRDYIGVEFQRICKDVGRSTGE
ncbi:MAG: wax ester/triacylglycerol synthase family O-acyltransferase [Halioglobus sp.]